MSTKTALIAGASSDIGSATAVAAAMRDAVKAGVLSAAAEAAGVSVEVRCSSPTSRAPTDPRPI
ncbi:hypothetical protein ACWC9T_18850 [Kitasatospora sp. NPDC001159]